MTISVVVYICMFMFSSVFVCVCVFPITCSCILVKICRVKKLVYTGHNICLGTSSSFEFLLCFSHHLHTFFQRKSGHFCGISVIIWLFVFPVHYCEKNELGLRKNLLCWL